MRSIAEGIGRPPPPLRGAHGGKRIPQNIQHPLRVPTPKLRGQLYAPALARARTTGATPWRWWPWAYSHSMVPGGLLVMSKVTLLIPEHSLMMRFEILRRRSVSRAAQSAVMPSTDSTARRTAVFS